MVVHRHGHLVLLGKRRYAPGDAERGGRRDDLGAERARDFEPAVDLLVGEIVAEAVVERVDRGAGLGEGVLDAAEVIERRLDAPRPQRLAGFADLFRRPAPAAGGSSSICGDHSSHSVSPSDCMAPMIAADASPPGVRGSSRKL